MRRAGFTLLEVSVALAILGVGIVTCLQLFSGALRIEDRASRQSLAVLAARGAMDALLWLPEINDHTEERTTPEGFHVKTTIRHAGAEDGIILPDPDLQSDQALRYLEVTVTWQDGRGSKTYTLHSLRMAPENE